MNSSARFASLDALRGLCAVLVALLHFGQRYPSGLSSLGFFNSSYLFVDFFFVLSGFVLTHAYADRIATRADYMKFAIRRIGRMWPLHVAILVLYFATLLVKLLLGQTGSTTAFTTEGPPTPANVALYATLSHALGTSLLGPAYDIVWNIPSWSISTEIWINILFALFCLQGRHATNIAAAVTIVISVGALVILVGNINTTIDYGIFRCAFGFFTGYFVYRLRAASVRQLGAGAEIVAILAVVAFVSANNIMPGLATLLTPIVFGIAVYVFSYEGGLISKALNTRPMQALGRWSYSIYMIHFVLLVYTAGAANRLSSISTSWRVATEIGAALFIFVTIALAAATYRWVELPARNYFYRRSSMSQRRAQQDPVSP